MATNSIIFFIIFIYVKRVFFLYEIPFFFNNYILTNLFLNMFNYKIILFTTTYYSSFISKSIFFFYNKGFIISYIQCLFNSTSLITSFRALQSFWRFHQQPLSLPLQSCLLFVRHGTVPPRNEYVSDNRSMVLQQVLHP